jgi:cytochrome c-type biogenesis protein CcmH
MDERDHPLRASRAPSRGQHQRTGEAGSAVFAGWAAQRGRLARSACRMMFALLMLVSFAAFAREAPPAAEDPVLEKKMLRIAAELRCLVCQNQTIADSNADLAVDLREQVRRMLKQGQSEEQIVRYMTDRYGDFVLYRPPVKGSTLLLWFGPAVLLVGGLAVLIIVLRRRNRLSDDRFEPDEPEAAADEGAAR